MLKYEYISLSIHTTMFRKIYCRYRKTTFMRKIENMEENSHGNTFAVDSLSNHKPNRKVLPQHQMSEFNDCLCSFTINAETKFLLHKVGNIRPFCIASTIIIIPLTNCYLQEPLWIQPYFEQKAEKYSTFKAKGDTKGLLSIWWASTSFGYESKRKMVCFAYKRSFYA